MKTKKKYNKPYIPSQRDTGAFAYFLVLKPLFRTQFFELKKT